MANNLPNGRFAVVDTVLSKTDATIIDALSGTQGDSGRIVNFALKDGSFAHNLDGQDVSLQVKDAAGKVKIVNGIYDRIDVTRGLFSMLIPGDVYQAAGDVEEARLVVTDSNNTVISSIPITFTVFANGVVISANASKDYINTINELIKNVQGDVENIQSTIDTQKLNFNALKTLADSIKNMIENNQAVGVFNDNQFKGNNTFDKNIVASAGVTGELFGNATTAGIATRNNLPFKYQSAIDLNILPNKKDVYTYDAYYFSNATTVKNTPKNLGSGLVETFVLTSATILQRFTGTYKNDNPVFQRVISNWQGDEPEYTSWKSERDLYSKDISFMGGTLAFRRIGNTVSVNMNVQNNTYQFKQWTKVADANTIPVGYRPTRNTLVRIEMDDSVDNGTTRLSGSLMLLTDGSIMSRHAQNTGNTASALDVSGTYITNDGIPS
ncbi:BppU family phage baseplate upper protein [Weissella hellenica]|nr:BppU family phage baseplate upper protein [Weissella hellenica]